MPKLYKYIVSYYAAGERRPSDCDADYYYTRSDAIAAGESEVARVAAIPVDQRMRTIDWAVRFTVRRIVDDLA